MVCDLEVSPIFPPEKTLRPASPFLQWVPWASVPHLHRYYDQLRLPIALPRLVRFSLSSPGTPYISGRQPDLSSSQATPLNTCPALSSRWGGGCLPCRGRPCCLPIYQVVGFPPPEAKYPIGPQCYIFRESMTRPAFPLRPASDSRCRVYPRTSLPTCRLHFDRVGLFLLPIFLLDAAASPAKWISKGCIPNC